MEEPFGALDDGTAVRRFTLTTSSGMKARILTYGGIVQELWAPDVRGNPANITLGFSTLDEYVRTGNSAYFGGVIGRVANRIARGRFTLDGVTYRLPVNQPPNSLHGGTVGFDKHVWEVVAAEALTDGALLTMRLPSPNGDQGYPGNLDVEVRYTLDGPELCVAFSATTDAPTVVNLTSHPYWNLAGEGAGAMYDHALTIPAGRYTPIDSTLIPTGEMAPVAGTPFDFTEPTTIGSRIGDPSSVQLRYAGGYDHNFVLDDRESATPVPAAHVWEPTSGRTIDVYTDQPGVHLYSGNSLDGTLRGTSGKRYERGAGLALEPQRFPDAPNQPTFPSAALRPGETYTAMSRYHFGTGTS
jgi:aldose 1-epimerase